ncbi:MAG TPA: hypothetical protein VGP72_20245, partial [Planctomycetota bacterium]
CCPDCARMLAATWRAVLNWTAQQGRAPQYLITLTCREPLPLWRAAPPGEQAALRTKAVALAQFLTRALTRLIAEIRQAYGPFEYVAFVELTTGRRTPGHRPHLHLLVQGPATAHRWLSRRWEFHTHGSFRVDIQRLRSPALAADYLVGYTVGKRKKAQQQHLSEWPGPRVRYSRGYFSRPVAEIRALLFPPAESSGQWEWVGGVQWLWYLRWYLACLAASLLAAAPAGGSRAIIYPKEPANGAAKQWVEDGPTQARPWLTCPCPRGFHADCRPGPARSVFAPKRS